MFLRASSLFFLDEPLSGSTEPLGDKCLANRALSQGHLGRCFLVRGERYSFPCCIVLTSLEWQLCSQATTASNLYTQQLSGCNLPVMCIDGDYSLIISLNHGQASFVGGLKYSAVLKVSLYNPSRADTRVFASCFGCFAHGWKYTLQKLNM